MERMMGVEQARARLGQPAEEVGAGGEPVIFTKRGEALAVLVSRDEYARLKELATRLSRAELEERLAAVRKRVKQAGLEPEVVDEAIKAVRQAI